MIVGLYLQILKGKVFPHSESKPEQTTFLVAALHLHIMHITFSLLHSFFEILPLGILVLGWGLWSNTSTSMVQSFVSYFHMAVKMGSL